MKNESNWTDNRGGGGGGGTSLVPLGSARALYIMKRGLQGKRKPISAICLLILGTEIEREVNGIYCS